jgi:hypothetical protein
MTLRTLAEGAAARLRARDAGPPGPHAGGSAGHPPDPASRESVQRAPDPAAGTSAERPPDPDAGDAAERPIDPAAGDAAECAPDPVGQSTAHPDGRPAATAKSAARHAWPALAGLVLGLAALGPGLAPGYLLSYDMVFVPRMPFSGALIGLTGGPPRAVPSDAVVAVASLLLPADILQKLILVLIFVAACSGAAALLDRGWPGGAPLPARLAAGVFYAWNPYVAERLLIGQWALLLGYAGLPWVLRLICTGFGRIRPARLLCLMIPAAIGGFTAMSITVLAAVPAALCRREAGRESAPREAGRKGAPREAGREGAPREVGREGAPREVGRERARRLTTVIACAALLSLPWLIPAFAVAVHTDPRGVDVFAARADTPFGRLGSLVVLSGIWNAQTVPRGYGGGGSVVWLLVVAAALGGYLLLARARRVAPGLGVAAMAGLVIAAIGVTSPSRAVLRDLVTAWAGFAVLRDGQQFVAPLALAEAVGLGALVAWIVAGAQRQASRATAALAAMAVLAPVVLLPGMAWGLAGRLRPVAYPADWLRARQVIDGDPAPGSVLLLPWAAYRRYPWNVGEAVFDPWSRLLGREVISNDGLQVGNLTLTQESADSIRLNRIVTARGPLTGKLRAAGVLYVVVDAGPLLGQLGQPGQSPGPGLAARARLPGARVVMAGRDLVVFRLPAAQGHSR